MQPYFFPYLGHFALIANCDEWIVFDVTQYRPKTWMNRNRVLHPSGGAMYVTVPLSNSSQSVLTCEARIADPERAHASVRGALSHYKRSAPHFADVVALVDATFAQLTGDSLVELDVAALRTVCAHLELPFRYRICSQARLEFAPPSGPGGWAPAIASAIGAEEYLNPISGRALFDPVDFAERSIDLCFLDMPAFVYDTGPFKFEPNLSILDVMMWNSPRAIRAGLGTARIVYASEQIAP